MIRVQVGSTVFECQSASEAVQVHNLLNATAASTLRHNTQPPVTALTKKTTKDYDYDGFIARLKLENGKKLNGHQMKDVLGIDSVHGVGPKIRSITKGLLNLNPQIVLDTYMTMGTNIYGKKEWSVHVPAQLF